MKRKLVVLLTAVLIFASFAYGVLKKEQSKTSDDSSGTQKKQDPVEISIAYWDIETALANGENDKMLKKVQDDLNIKLDPMNTTWDDYKQKIQLWATSSQLPDLFAIDVVGSSFYYKWIDEEVVKPLPNDLSKYPLLEEYLKTPDVAALKVNNKFYTIPRRTWPDVKMSGTERGIVYRWDLAQKAGITKEPETYDELRAMILAIIKNNTEGKNIAGLTAVQTQLIDGVLFPYSLPLAMSDGSGNDYKWVKKDGKYVPAYFAGDALATFQLARDMYKEGTIEKDIALTKSQQAYDKFVQGQSAGIIMNTQAFNIETYLGRPWAKVYPDKPFHECVKLCYPLKAKDGNTYGAVFKTYWSESYISTDDPVKMDAILRMADYYLKKENKDMLRNGFEGEDYTVSGDGIFVRKEGVVLLEKYPFSNTSGLFEFDNTYNVLNLTGNEEYDKYVSMVMAYYDKVKKTTLPEYNPAHTNISTPLKNAFVIKPAEDLLTIMTGKDPVEKMYKDLMDNYERKGLSKMIDEVNKVISSN